MTNGGEQHSKAMEEMLRVHDQAAARFRVELLQRSAGEVLFDDYLLDQLEKGKPFKIALRKANAKFPAEALNPGSDDFAAVESRYEFILGMREIDGYRAELERTKRQIAEADQKIDEFLQSMQTHPDAPSKESTPPA